MSDLFISKETAEQDLLSCSAFLAERIKSSDGRGDAMSAVIPRYLIRGNVDLAAELANAIDEPFTHDRLLLIVAERCTQIDDDEYAMQLADAIEDHGMRSHAFERIALSAVGKGASAKALEIADEMAHPDVVYAALAAKQELEGDAAGASSTLERIMFPSARVHALQQIAAGRIKADETDAAIASLDDAVTAANDIEHSEEKIRDLLDIGNLFLEAGQNEKAISTFEAARRRAEGLDNTHRDFFLVNCALGCLYAGSPEKSDDILDLVKDKTQMASALLAVSREEWKHDEKTEAVDTLEEAYEILKSQRESEIRDSRARNTLFASIAAQLAGFGKTDRGVDVALENVDTAERTAALSQIAQILTIQKEDELARQTLTLIDEDSDRLLALINIADAKLAHGEADASAALLAEASSLADTVQQLGARSTVLASIAKRYTAQGHPDKAREVCLQNLEVISAIRDESSQAAAVAALADIYTQADMDLSEPERVHIGRLARKIDW